jgi:nitroimidazol reductase NimA-like FMN-containing flavoprotein (pyridoxamine 5'-phosphate oxidase superfamily)
MPISVRFSHEDGLLVKEYAAHNGMTVSQVIRRATLEMIEDEMEAELAEKAWEEFQKDPVGYTQDEIEKMLGIR